MSIYDDLQKVASNVLKDFKQGVVEYVKITPGTGAVDEPGSSTQTKTKLNATVKGVSQKYINQGLAIVGDLQITFAFVEGLIVDASDFVEVDTKRFKIRNVIRKPEAGTTVAYVLIVKN